MIITAAIVLGIGTPAQAQWNHPLDRWAYQALSDCETGTDLAHATRTYVGPFGWTRQVHAWYSDTPARNARRLTYGQWARILDRAFWYGHEDRGPVGPWGHGCFRHLYRTNPKFRAQVCNNPKHQVRRWCR